MSFQIDPKWSPEELDLHKERWELLMKMAGYCDDTGTEYKLLAVRYHEIEDLINEQRTSN